MHYANVAATKMAMATGIDIFFVCYGDVLCYDIISVFLWQLQIFFILICKIFTH